MRMNTTLPSPRVKSLPIWVTNGQVSVEAYRKPRAVAYGLVSLARLLAGRSIRFPMSAPLQKAHAELGAR